MPIAELRRRFALDEPDAIWRIQRDGEAAFIGLPEREATKIADLWSRDEIGLELSVEVRAPVVVGIYPMRIARFVTDGANGHVTTNGNGHLHPPTNGHAAQTGETAMPDGVVPRPAPPPPPEAARRE